MLAYKKNVHYCRLKATFNKPKIGIVVDLFSAPELSLNDLKLTCIIAYLWTTLIVSVGLTNSKLTFLYTRLRYLYRLTLRFDVVTVDTYKEKFVQKIEINVSHNMKLLN